MNDKNIEVLKEMIIDFNEYSTDYTKTRCREIEQVLTNTLNYINQLQSNWNSLRECIIDIIDGAREELNIIMQDDNLEYTNECSLQFEVIRKNLEIVLDKMNELEGVDNENN